MDPVMRDGRKSAGNATAHADFMNGWTEDGAGYDDAGSPMYESGTFAALRFLTYSKAEKYTVVARR